MADPVEITKDITVAWLSAYQTDLSVRRQKGVVPVFTPTYEEVMDFIRMTYAGVTQLKSMESESVKKSPKKDEKTEAKGRKKT